MHWEAREWKTGAERLKGFTSLPSRQGKCSTFDVKNTGRPLTLELSSGYRVFR
jgi:hypothetical protein